MNKVKQEGIYIFGGKNGKDELNKYLYFINTFTKPIKINKLEGHGKPPSPRYSFSMNYC